ncbi:hypothetical protein DLM75_12590 [Leptospira stimsonii]|uniref:Uncharacterized protein n=1 Tax=Leptospira stimsonii TaxID=2202203 RepID=A0A396Z2T7_9LEPT|nr:hypothetical protein DLM75_12590 [Leptospira stimsonii]
MRSRSKKGLFFGENFEVVSPSPFSEFVFNQDILLPSYRSPGFSGRSFLFLGAPTWFGSEIFDPFQFQLRKVFLNFETSVRSYVSRKISPLEEGRSVPFRLASSDCGGYDNSSVKKSAPHPKPGWRGEGAGKIPKFFSITEFSFLQSFFTHLPLVGTPTNLVPKRKLACDGSRDFAKRILQKRIQRVRLNSNLRRNSDKGKIQRFKFTKLAFCAKENSFVFFPPAHLHHPIREGRSDFTEDRRMYDKGLSQERLIYLTRSLLFIRDIILLFSHRYLTFRQILDTKR